jgi:hypothetical protein
VRAEPNRLVDKFETRFELPEALVCVAHVLISVHVVRIQVDRALVLRDRLVETKLGLEA